MNWEKDRLDIIVVFTESMSSLVITGIFTILSLVLAILLLFE